MLGKNKNKKDTILPYYVEPEPTPFLDGIKINPLVKPPTKEEIIEELTVQELYELITKEKYIKISDLVERINVDLKILNMLGVTVVDETEEKEILPTLALRYDAKNKKLGTVVVYTTKEVE